MRTSSFEEFMSTNPDIVGIYPLFMTSNRMVDIWMLGGFKFSEIGGLSGNTFEFPNGELPNITDKIAQAGLSFYCEGFLNIPAPAVAFYMEPNPPERIVKIFAGIAE